MRAGSAPAGADAEGSPSLSTEQASEAIEAQGGGGAQGGGTGASLEGPSDRLSRVGAKWEPPRTPAPISSPRPLRYSKLSAFEADRPLLQTPQVTKLSMP